MSLADTIRDVQTAIGVTVDGNAGPQTWSELHRRLVPVTVKPPPGDKVDARSEGNIATLHQQVRPYARALVTQCAAQGITIKVLSGTRTYAEQDALFKKGGVTKARGGFSNHNFGIAFDIGVFKGTAYLPDSPLYKAVGAIGRGLGLSWGGDWKSFVDEPHFQLRPAWATGMSESAMLSELRKRHDTGRDAFA